MLLKLISPLRPGLIESGRRERLPVPDHADQAERVGARRSLGASACRARPQPALRDFRSYEDAEVALGDGLTVVRVRTAPARRTCSRPSTSAARAARAGPRNEREVVRFGAGATRVVVRCEAEDGPHELSVGFEPGQPKRMRVDGATVERLLDAPSRPLVSVFLPDRLELIKGAPALRRAHLDQFVAALWPARAETRRAYAQALAQRNALIAQASRRAAGRATRWRAGTRSWRDYGIALMADRPRAVEAIAEPCARLGAALGLEGELAVVLPPALTRGRRRRSCAAELAERVDSDLERGFTGHGPAPRRARDCCSGAASCARTARRASSGSALLALLLAEREAIAERRAAPRR